jgi:hypothetical protein
MAERHVCTTPQHCTACRVRPQVQPRKLQAAPCCSCTVLACRPKLCIHAAATCSPLRCGTAAVLQRVLVLEEALPALALPPLGPSSLQLGYHAVSATALVSTPYGGAQTAALAQAAAPLSGLSPGMLPEAYSTSGREAAAATAAAAENMASGPKKAQSPMQAAAKASAEVIAQLQHVLGAKVRRGDLRNTQPEVLSYTHVLFCVIEGGGACVVGPYALDGLALTVADRPCCAPNPMCR